MNPKYPPSFAILLVHAPWFIATQSLILKVINICKILDLILFPIKLSPIPPRPAQRNRKGCPAPPYQLSLWLWTKPLSCPKTLRKKGHAEICMMSCWHWCLKNKSPDNLDFLKKWKMFATPTSYSVTPARSHFARIPERASSIIRDVKRRSLRSHRSKTLPEKRLSGKQSWNSV